MTPEPENDLDRLKTEYASRRARLQGSDVYSSLNTAYLFSIQQRQRAAVDLFRQLGMTALHEKRLLEVGCGQGDVLQEMMFHRFNTAQLHGVELLPDRLLNAHRRFPSVNFAAADAQKLPYADSQFDLVLQYTVFSSILNGSVKANIAREMLRVVKADGIVLWYDFWLNPTNRQTQGIRKDEIVRLFPNCDFTFRRITLAPPLARRIVPLSWTLALLLERFGFLNTHYLVAIRPKVT
jgi:ubiquinone/menaquinone biosynthesis C-methylase UbiE